MYKIPTKRKNQIRPRLRFGEWKTKMCVWMGIGSLKGEAEFSGHANFEGRLDGFGHVTVNDGLLGVFIRRIPCIGWVNETTRRHNTSGVTEDVGTLPPTVFIHDGN
jgi:hypothetical protein